MAAFTDLTDYRERLSAPAQVSPFLKTGLTITAGRPFDGWLAASLPGTAPTTAAAPTNATAGALPMYDATTGQLFVPGASLGVQWPGMYVLCDRLSHQGGLSGIVTGAVTTNLPTAALTRYTDGVGVMLGISVYTVIGTTGTTITCTYTNEAGTGSRVSPLVVIGGTGFREASRMLLVPLAAGDTGVRSVESSTLTATTGTAGAFGYTLFKPLVGFVASEPGSKDFNLLDGGMCGGLPEIVNGACLFWLYITPASTTLMGALNLTAI